MRSAPPTCTFHLHGPDRVLHLLGTWTLAHAEVAIHALGTLDATQFAHVATVHAAPSAHVDTAGALCVLHTLARAGADLNRLRLDMPNPVARRIFELVRARNSDWRAPSARPAWSWLARLGARSVHAGLNLLGLLAGLAQISHEVARALARPRVFRSREWVQQLGHVGVQAIPVVALISGLIGVVFAYLLGLQAEQYGANIFVVDGVALGMTREFAPLLVATIVAGRSGAAFTAQLGTMKLTEELDAIRMLGLSAEQVLVVPRVLALIVALPLLVFVGDIAGLAGALAIAHSMLDITPTTFIERLHEGLAPRHYLIGLAKAPVFALVIAIIGCRQGMSVARDTRAVGLSTTATVVQCIVAVIILDALFAVLLQALDW